MRRPQDNRGRALIADTCGQKTLTSRTLIEMALSVQSVAQRIQTKMTKKELQRLRQLLDIYKVYLFKKYHRTNSYQTNAEYVYKNVLEEIEN